MVDAIRPPGRGHGPCPFMRPVRCHLQSQSESRKSQSESRDPAAGNFAGKGALSLYETRKESKKSGVERDGVGEEVGRESRAVRERERERERERGRGRGRVREGLEERGRERERE